MLQSLFHVSVFHLNKDYILYSAAVGWAGLLSLCMDRLIALVLTAAALKLQVRQKTKKG